MVIALKITLDMRVISLNLWHHGNIVSVTYLKTMDSKIKQENVDQQLDYVGQTDDDENDQFEVTCRLIPLGTALTFILVLLVLSTVSWMFRSESSIFTAVSIVFQISLIPVIVMHATKIRIKVSKSGMEILSHMHQSAMFNRLGRSWKDLHSVRLRRLNSPDILLDRLKTERQFRFRKPSIKERIHKLIGKGWWYSGFLVMDFKSGGMAPFPLAGFSPQAIEDLFIGISRWADPMSLNPDVIALQRDVLTGQSFIQDNSYTKMWEESLRQQFEVTNFVPLLGGHKLRNGSIRVMMLLACGGMSSVYLAKLADDTRVVVKEMRVPLDDEPDLKEQVHKMFSKEAQILSKLDHSNIVRVRDHFVENSRDYLVLEYIPGLTLRQHVQMHGVFEQNEAVDIGLQIAKVIEYLHKFEPPILHRDLTPDNFILTEPERKVMLVDFGAANEYIGHLTGTLIGKQCYIPPEQFRGKAEPLSDIYAAAGTLYFLLTGEDPEPITPSKPKSAIDTICDDLDDLIFVSTSEDPKDRKYNATQFFDKLTEIKDRI